MLIAFKECAFVEMDGMAMELNVHTIAKMIPFGILIDANQLIQTQMRKKVN